MILPIRTTSSFVSATTTTSATTSTTAATTSNEGDTDVGRVGDSGDRGESKVRETKVANQLTAYGVIAPHMDYESFTDKRPEEIPWESLTREQKIDENDFRTKLNMWVFTRKLYRRLSDPNGFPVPPKHWPPAWRMDAPLNYIVPREEPWYPSTKVSSSISPLAWLPHFTTPQPIAAEQKREVKRPLEGVRIRPETRLGIGYTLNAISGNEIITTGTRFHPTLPDGPWFWYMDVHFCYNHATIIEMDYWSLRLGFNIYPLNWQAMVGLCKHCGDYQPPGIYPSDMPHSRPTPPRSCEYCDEIETLMKPMFRCRGCNWVFYCCKSHQKADWKAHREFCKYAQQEGLSRLRSLTNLEFLPPCGIGSVSYDFAMFAFYRMTRYEIVLDGPSGARYQLPSRYNSDNLADIYRKL